ncbi:hypothetical protein LKO27_08325 [Tessaracoccus sp. OS52]|uniref:hypothetical protein n=1 Tax=Tessaracoccus sp. OS52 TaxID=2886691 RepID=UPI001D0FB3F8|nr:hypothetical protein [Tessaracoccus sp. OS52]MCC2593412.1 hypothetical protein [Tessaracoccus sp. OS52]
MDSSLLVLVTVLVVLGVAIGVFFIVRKQQYLAAVRARGWTWVERPDVGIVVGLNNPPFGVGFNRSVDDQVLGTSRSGVGFQAFRYRSDTFRSGGYVITMRLPKPLPPFYLFNAQTPRDNVSGHLIVPGPLQAVATDPAFGTAAHHAVAPALARPPMDSSGRPMQLDLSIDHDQLVMLHAPRDVEELAKAVDWLADVQRALVSSPAMQFEGPPAPPYLSFHQRPHWRYTPRDDSVLQLVNHTRGGHGHRAEDIITSDNFGVPFIRLEHHWDTTHTRTDAKGNVQTYTQHHQEIICEFATTFPFRELSVNWGLFGDRVRFESAAFNDQFTVRSPSARFASDVMHPRQLEYFLRTSPGPFSIESDGRILVSRSDWLPDELEWFSQFLLGFFARVPDFTWKELGAWPRPIAEVENYSR